MKWFLNLLKDIWRGITKAWNWVSNKITNIFSSKKNNNTEPEKTGTEEQNQQQSGQEEVVITPEQSHEPAAYSGNNPNTVEVGGTERLKQDSSVSSIQSLADKLPSNIKFIVDYQLDERVKSLIDVDTLELIEKYPGASTIFISENSYSLTMSGDDTEFIKQYSKRLFNYLSTVDKLIKVNEELIDVLNSEKILDSSYKRCYTPNDVMMHCGSVFYYNSGLIKLLEHLATRGEPMLTRIKNHPELAKCVLLEKKSPANGKLCTEIFDILFSKDQEDILGKLEYDLDFTKDTLSKAYYPENVEDFVCKMSYLKNKEDVRLLKHIHHSDYSGIAYDPSNQYNPWQQLIKKFFEHHYNEPFIYKMAINLENIDLGVQIDITVNNNRDEDIVYDEASTTKQYKVYLKEGCNNNDDIDSIIDKVLDVHFNRIKGIVKERLPGYLKKELVNYRKNTGQLSSTMTLDMQQLIDNAYGPSIGSGEYIPNNLKQICLMKIVESLNKS